MSSSRSRTGIRARAPMLLAAAGLALAVPGVGLALPDSGDSATAVELGFAPFTPAGVDPEMAARLAQRLGAKGQAMRFTPAGTNTNSDRTATVAVRVDDRTARIITVRGAIDSARGEAGLGPGAGTLAIAPTRYNLGVARGYQSFVKPISLPDTVSDAKMPDLSTYRPSRGIAADKPSRFQPRIAIEGESTPGRAPRTLEGLGEQSVDLGGAYRLSRNLNVTAGVRLSQDRDRLAPLTDGVADDQAVYVGTQFKF